MLCSTWRQSDYRKQCCIMVQKSDSLANISNKKRRWLVSICGHRFNKNGSTWEIDRIKEIGENALSTPLYFLWEGKVLSHISSFFFFQVCTFLVLLSLNELIFILHSVSSQSNNFFIHFYIKLPLLAQIKGLPTSCSQQGA